MPTLCEKPKILLVGDSRENVERTLSAGLEGHDAAVVQNPMRALALLTREQYAGVYVSSEYFQEAFEIKPGLGAEDELAFLWLVDDPGDIGGDAVAAGLAEKSEPLAPCGARNAEVMELAAIEKAGLAIDEEGVRGEAEAGESGGF